MTCLASQTPARRAASMRTTLPGVGAAAARFVKAFDNRMSTADSRWEPFQPDASRQRGSEGGAIVADEEYGGAARITLERGTRTAPFAITCGVYGWIVHTRFFAQEEAARRAFADLKGELARIVEGLPAAGDLGSFVERFP